MVRRLLVFTSICCTIVTLQAIITPIKTLDRFNRTIINQPLVVAYLYESEPHCMRKERKQVIAKNNAVLKAISRDGRYQAAGIDFVTTNLSKDHACGLKQEYDIRDQDSLLLFAKEEVVPTQLTGTFNRAEVENFIESQWGDKIETILKAQEQERKQRLAELKASYAYWGTGPYGPPVGYWGGYGGYGGYGGGYGYGPGNGYLSIAGGFSW